MEHGAAVSHQLLTVGDEYTRGGDEKGFTRQRSGKADRHFRQKVTEELSCVATMCLSYLKSIFHA